MSFKGYETAPHYEFLPEHLKATLDAWIEEAGYAGASAQLARMYALGMWDLFSLLEPSGDIFKLGKEITHGVDSHGQARGTYRNGFAES